MSALGGERRDARADGVKLLVPHSAACWFAGEEPVAKNDRVFVVYDGIEHLDQLGRRNGHGGWWHRFRCNDPDCPAVAVVRWDILAALIDNALKPAARASQPQAERATKEASDGR